MTVDEAAKKITVVREIDGGLETVNVSIPAVLTADLRYGAAAANARLPTASPDMAWHRARVKH